MSEILGIVLGVILFAVCVLTMWGKSDGRDWPVG